MNSVSAVLPRLFHWVFAVLAVLAAVAAIAVCVAIAINPKLPVGTHFGPITVDLMGQPGTVALHANNGDSDFTVTALRGNVKLFVARAGGLIDVVKQYGLPLILIRALFLAVLFDLLRRLFRNVGRGESFTRQSVFLVQIVGVSLIIFSLVSRFAEGWFAHGVFTYLANNAAVTISGTSLHLPAMRGMTISHGLGFPFGSPVFFSGLLVLALSEVFRQGLALKNEADLTV